MLATNPFLCRVVFMYTLIVTSPLVLGQIGPLMEDFRSGDPVDWRRIDNMSSFAWGPGIYQVRADEAFHLESSNAVPKARANSSDASLFANWILTNDPALANGILRVKARVNELGNAVILGMRYQGSSTAYGFVADSSDGSFTLGSYRGSNSLTTHTNTLSSQSDFRENEDWQFEVATIDDRAAMKFWRDTEAEPEAPQLVFRDPNPITGEFRSEAWLGGYVANVATDTKLHLVFDDVQFRSVAGWVDGDFNINQKLGIGDLNALQNVARAETTRRADQLYYDLTGDEIVDQVDVATWVHDLAKTYFGDANLDGEFNSGDLVTVLTAGEYEDAIDDNSGWAEGDWDTDGDFTSGDLVLALQDGGYELEHPAPAAAIPEPAGICLFSVAIIWLGAVSGARRRNHELFP